MKEEYLFELEVQTAVKTFLTYGDSDESFEYQNLRQNTLMTSYANLCTEAKEIITSTKTHMLETERFAFKEFGAAYFDEPIEKPEIKLSEEERLATEIEVQAAVKAFFKNGDTRLYRFLGKEDFFKSYAMICDNARRILIKERKQSILREQKSEQVLGNKDSIASTLQNPTSPAIETEVAESVDFYMEHNDTNYKILSEDEFFKEYGKNSYDARRLAVSARIASSSQDQTINIVINTN